MFYRQSIRYNGGYEADTSLYVNMSIDDRGIRLIKWIYHYLYALRGDTVLIAFYMGLVVVITAIGNYAIIRWYQRYKSLDSESTSRLYAQIASLLMFVTGSMYLPIIHPRFYKGSWCTYAWHSPTQQLMIMFAMFSLLVFLMIYEKYEKRINPFLWMLLMIFTLMSVWAKPSFMLVFIPTLIAVFIIELLKHKREGQLWKRFSKLFVFGLSMVPSGLLILFLNNSIFGEGSSNKVAVNTGGHAFGYNIYIAAFCGLLFPTIVMMANYRKLKELPFQIALGMLIMGIAEWMVFFEDGSRGSSGNFAWGRQFGCYYFFVCAIAITYYNIKDGEFMAADNSRRRWYLIIIGLVFAIHVLSQTYHLYLMFRGYDFYC